MTREKELQKMKLDLNGRLLFLSSLLCFMQLSIVGKEMGSVVM